MGKTFKITEDKIKRAQGGDKQAIEFIVGGLHRPIYSYIFRMVNRREDAEDLAQETFIKISRHLKRYDTKRSFSTWVFTIASRTVYDWLRKKRIRKELYIIDDPDHPFETGAVDRSYKQTELKYDVERALGMLNYKYRQIILLFYWRELTYQEIGAALKMPVNTIKTYLNRAKKELKKHLKP